MVIDQAGNGNLATDIYTVVYDSTNPQVIITSSAGESGDDFGTAPIPITITFNEEVTHDFFANDVNVTNGDVSAFGGGPLIYNAEITPDGFGTVEVDIAGNVVKDLADNPNEPAETFKIKYVDVPTVTVNQAAAQDDPTNVTPILFTVVFSELMTGFGDDDADVDLSESTNPGELTVTISGVDPGTEYTVSVNGMANEGTIVVSIPAGAAEADDDAEPNFPSTSTDNQVSYDFIAPTIILTTTSSSPTDVTPIPVTITLSEPLSDFQIGFITVENGTAANLTQISELSYRVEITPTDEGDVNISVSGGVSTDEAGNPNIASNELIIAFEAGTPYVLSIARLDPSPTTAAAVRFLVTFSEIVFGVDAGDFELTTTGTLAGVSITSITGTGPDRIVTVGTGTGSGTLRLDVAEGAEIEDEDENLMVDLPYVVGEVYQIGLSTFTDVPPTYWAWEEIEILYDAGVTDGCSQTPTLRFCPNANVTRAEMAKFLLTAINGDGYEPIIDAQRTFLDVSPQYWAYEWIENLSEDGLTDGCNQAGTNYCPDSFVTRAEMAKFLLSAMNADNLLYQPPQVPMSSFWDVPNNYWAKNWIEELFDQGVTTGCTQSPLNYCPEGFVTRAEMAVFLVRAFDLP